MDGIVANTEKLISANSSKLKQGGDQVRHPQDGNSVMEFIQEGTEERGYRLKQLSHHMELWQERHRPDVSVFHLNWLSL